MNYIQNDSICGIQMCYEKWGVNDGFLDVMPSGDGGCYDPLKFWDPCNGHKYDCIFGSCPIDFSEDKNTDTCATFSNCQSQCGAGADEGDCVLNSEIENRDFSNWMQEFDNLPLNRITVLGAHHALARLRGIDFDVIVENDFGKNVDAILAFVRDIPLLDKAEDVVTQQLLPMMSSCQSDEFSKLLISGVRFFDLRPFYHTITNTLRDQHGGYGPSIEEAFSQIKDFIDVNKSEVIYISIVNVMSSDCVECDSNPYQYLIPLINQQFGDCNNGIIQCGNQNTILKDITNNNKNIILVTDDTTLLTYDIFKGNFQNTWQNTVDADDLRNKIKNDLDSIGKSKDDSQFVGIQNMLTPDNNDFLALITPRYTSDYVNQANKQRCQSLICLAKAASLEELIPYLDDYDHINQIQVDWSNQYGNMDVILQYNRNKL